MDRRVPSVDEGARTMAFCRARPLMIGAAGVDRTHPALREMEEIAWILRSDPHRNQIGFVRSCRLPDEERFVLRED